MEELIGASPNRRSLLKTLGIAAAVTGSSLCFGPRPAQAQSTLDADVLNFALNLEYLTAEFYTQAATGASITLFDVHIDGRASGTNPMAGGTVIGGKQLNFFSNDAFTLDLIAEIATNERAHVTLLRDALGSAAIARPNLNLNALGFGFDSEHDLLRASRILEEIGLSAYTSSIGLLKAPNHITLAGLLLGTEAEHAAGIRMQMVRLGIPIDPVDEFNRTSRSTASSNRPLSINSDGLIANRTVGQILYRLFGKQGGDLKGGFFPAGLNGLANLNTAP
jgi:hypothetical protein